MNNKQKTENNENHESDRILEIVLTALDDMKGLDIRVIDVRDRTSITDRMVIVSGTSTRHLKALADHVVLESKKNGFTPLGIEGENGADWILVDLVDVVVHVMMPEIRAFYALEKLWSVGGEHDSSS
jgi:ribosome-associated protein